MIPKKYTTFKKDISNEVEVHQSVVDDLVQFYYAKVREALSNLDDNRVYVEGLGTFSIRKARLEKAIVKNKSYLGNLEKRSYKGYSKVLSVENKIDKYEKMLIKIKEINDKRSEFKNNRS